MSITILWILTGQLDVSRLGWFAWRTCNNSIIIDMPSYLIYDRNLFSSDIGEDGGRQNKLVTFQLSAPTQQSTLWLIQAGRYA